MVKKSAPELRRSSRAIAFLATFFAVGIGYWAIPYAKVSLPDSLLGTGLVIPLVVAAVVRAVAGASFRQAFAIVGLAVPLCVLARVQIDTMKDPTSHNLWPFEIVIAAFIGFAAAAVGALVGGVFGGARKH